MAHDGGDLRRHDATATTTAAAPPHDDLVHILLDPFQDKRTAYVFSVNPRGARGEGLVYAGSTSLNWDGIWDAESRIDGHGWSAEMRIPFKTISFKPGLTAWGINLERAIARKQETIRLSGTDPGQQLQQSQRSRRPGGHRGRPARARASPSGPTAWPARPRTTPPGRPPR